MLTFPPPLDACLTFMLIVNISNYPAAWNAGGGGHFRDWFESAEAIYSEAVTSSEIEIRDSFHQGFRFIYWSATHSTTRFVFPDNLVSFVAWFMRRLIRHNHKLGKMFSAPSHAVNGKGFDLEHVDPRLLWREEEVRIEPGPLWHGSMENVKALEEVVGFSCFSRFIFLHVGGWRGAGFAGFKLNMMDQTSWKINTQSQRRTLCHSLHCALSNSVHQLCTCARTHTHTHDHTLNYHRCSLCSNTQAPQTLTLL